MMDLEERLKRAFPGQRAPVLAAAKFMGVAPSTIYRYIKEPSRLPRDRDLLITALEFIGPDALEVLNRGD